MTDYTTLLRDHVTLTCRSVDRIFLQAYVPKLQSVGGVCQFLYWQRGFGIPSSAAFGKIGDAYVAEVYPALADYWAKRRRKVKPPLDNYTLRLLARQDARCPICEDNLLSADQPPQSPDDWERWWLGVTRQAIAADYLVHHGRPGPPHNDPTRLVHASCRRGLHARQGGKPAPTRVPSRLA